MTKEKGIIIGNNSEHGLEFIQLALHDYDQVILVGPESDLPDEVQKNQEVGIIDLDLGAEDLAQELLEELDFFENMGRSLPVTLVVNLLEFHIHDPWEPGKAANPSIQLSQLMELNEFFIKKMLHHGQGEVMNVISRPEKCPTPIASMFQQTRAMLMEMAETFNQALEDTGVSIHTLSYSPQSFALQSSQLPAKVAHDMMPKSCSARDIADYGYQVLRARRGMGAS